VFLSGRSKDLRGLEWVNCKILLQIPHLGNLDGEWSGVIPLILKNKN
jgi:hypothetical protein